MSNRNLVKLAQLVAEIAASLGTLHHYEGDEESSEQMNRVCDDAEKVAEVENETVT